MDSAWFVPLALAFGLVVGVAGTVTVFVARNRGQRAVAAAAPEAPAGVSLVIDALESAGVVVDASNNVVRASSRALASGLVKDHTLVHASLIEIVDRVRRDGVPVSEQVVIARGPFGEARLYLLVSAVNIGTRFVMLLADDRTDIHRTDEVRRDFLANISHELKTPIGAVGLLAEALASAANEPVEVKRFAKRLSQESERLASITGEIIELSRLQAADPLAVLARVSIRSVIDQTIDRNRVAADARRISLVTSGRINAEVFGDEKLLVTALNNLVANALQYSPDGSRIGIGVKTQDGVVEIAVTDQGVGIPEDEHDRVFERFYRVDAARSRNSGGSGLGLSIVKHVVQNHGGDVRVWSHPGKGSTFTARLPEASVSASSEVSSR